MLVEFRSQAGRVMVASPNPSAIPQRGDVVRLDPLLDGQAAADYSVGARKFFFDAGLLVSVVIFVSPLETAEEEAARLERERAANPKRGADKAGEP